MFVPHIIFYMNKKRYYSQGNTKRSLNFQPSNMFTSPVYDIPVDDLVYEGSDGQTNMIGYDIQDSIKCGQVAAKYIIQNDLLDKTWTVAEDGLLKRIMIRCDGFVDNCTIPGQPEYNKCWKYRISGCGCGGPYGCPPIEEKVKPIIKNSCNPNYVIKCGNTRASACTGSSSTTAN